MKSNLSAAEAFPLSWPDSWPRTPTHMRSAGAQFKGGATSVYDPHAPNQQRYVGRSMITFDRARKLLVDELDRLKAKGVVLSTNLPLRNDGNPRASARLVDGDPGVAVYFTLKGKQMVMATDAYTNIAANVRSLGLAIEALRQLERHGGGVMMERAFTGFAALPAPEGSAPKRAWWVVLNYGGDPEARADLSPDEINARFKVLAKRRHPDNKDGGSVEAFQELQDARDAAVKDLGG